MNVSLTGTAAYVAVAIGVVLGILCWQNPEILGWLLGTFVYQGPK